jgi:DNA-binding CsgD family transcriptional regulator
MHQQEMNELLQQTYQLLDIGCELVVRDLNGYYLYASPNIVTACIESGVLATGESLIGKNLKEIYPQEHQQFLENDAAVVEKQCILSFHEFTQQLNRNYSHWMVKKTPLKINTEIIGVMSLSRCCNFLSGVTKKVNLSVRQLQVLSASFYGLSSKEIARKLNISHRTVDDYANILKDKLGLNKKSDFQTYISQNNLEQAVKFFFECPEN